MTSTNGTKLLTDLLTEVVGTPTKAKAAAKPKASATKKAPAKASAKSKKHATKDGARSKAVLNRVVKMRQGGASWRTIGNAIETSPRTALRMYDEVMGKGAHHGLLEGKGGRTSALADAKVAGSGARYGVDPAKYAKAKAAQAAAKAKAAKAADAS